MIKPLLVVSVLVLLIFNQVRTDVVEARTHLPFLIKPQDLEPPIYVTISGEEPKLTQNLADHLTYLPVCS